MKIDAGYPKKMWERVLDVVAGGLFSILKSRLALATILSNVTGASFFLKILYQL